MQINNKLIKIKDNDSGWVNLTLPNPNFIQSTGFATCGVKRIGNLIYLRGMLNIVSGVTASSATVAQIPDASIYNELSITRYVTLTTYMAEGGNGNKANVATVRADGTIRLHQATIGAGWVSLDGIAIAI